MLNNRLSGSNEDMFREAYKVYSYFYDKQLGNFQRRKVRISSSQIDRFGNNLRMIQFKK